MGPRMGFHIGGPWGPLRLIPHGFPVHGSRMGLTIIHPAWVTNAAPAWAPIRTHAPKSAWVPAHGSAWVPDGSTAWVTHADDPCGNFKKTRTAIAYQIARQKRTLKRLLRFQTDHPIKSWIPRMGLRMGLAWALRMGLRMGSHRGGAMQRVSFSHVRVVPGYAGLFCAEILSIYRRVGQSTIRAT